MVSFRELFSRLSSKADLESLVGNYNPLYMSASIGSDGKVAVEHAPGEPYTESEQAEVQSIARVGEKIHRNRLTGKYIDEIYSELMRSEEGRAYVEHLKQNGNGKANPGMLETIIVANAGEGLVAATIPDYVKSNLIVNADYIESWARAMSRKNGLPVKENIKGAIIHELNHQFYQTSSDLRQSEPKLEYDNDFSLIEFYMGLAKKSPGNKELYIKKAQMFTERYSGAARATMDSYIEKNTPREEGLERKLRNDFASDKCESSAGQGYLIPEHS